MLNQTYYANSVIRLVVTIKDFDCQPINPASISARLVLPDGSVIVFSNSQFTPTNTGVYYVDYVVAQEGLHRLVVTSINPNQVMVHRFECVGLAV
jgi:uncharacterized lipoprotein YmbA